MNKTFQLKNGVLTVSENIISIQDGAAKNIRLRLISSSSWVIYGVFSVLRYLNTGDRFLLWSGVIIGVGHLTILMAAIFTSAKSEISVDEIRSIKIKKWLGDKFLDIKLKGNKTRRITEIGNLEQELKQVFAPYLKRP